MGSKIQELLLNTCSKATITNNFGGQLCPLAFKEILKNITLDLVFQVFGLLSHELGLKT